MLRHPSQDLNRVPLRRFAPQLILLASALFAFNRLAMHPADLLVGPQHQGANDLTSAFLAYHQFPAWMSQASGEGPWWNPWALGGTPWYGNPQAALWYPPNWLYRIADASVVMSWVLVGHLVWGGLGAYSLARRWGCHGGAALFAGLAYLAAPFLVAQAAEGHYNQICVVSWLPWTWWSWEEFVAGRRRGAVALVGCLTLSFAAGHIQEWYYQGVLLAALFTGESWRRRRTGSSGATGPWLRQCLVVAAIAAGILAVELIPNILYASQTVRGGRIPASQAGEISLGHGSWRQLVLPFSAGGPDAYRGPGHFFWETWFHFGVVPLVLATLAVARARRCPTTRRLVLLVAISVGFAFGDGSPLFEAAHNFLPGAGLFRAPSRALFFASLGVALLAALAVEHLLVRRGPATTAPEATSDSAVGERLVPASLSRWMQLALCGLFAVTLGELGVLAHRVTRTIPRELIRQPAAVVARLAAQEGAARVLAEQGLLSDREAWRAGIYKVQGYDPAPLVRQVALVSSFQESGDAAPLALGFRAIDLSRLNPVAIANAGVRWALVSPQSQPPPAPWSLVEQGTMPAEVTLRDQTVRQLGYELYELRTALPRAYVVGQVRVATAKQVALAVGQLDGRREVLAPSDPLPNDGTPRSEFRPVSLHGGGASRLRMEVELQHPGLLVVADTWAPGWTAVVDGERTPLLPANVAGRAVPLDAGAHVVELRYWPPGLTLGAGVSLASVVVGIWLGRPSGSARVTRSGVSSGDRGVLSVGSPTTAAGR